ncbi:MAG: glycosyltransferase family 4 protein [Candidatus Hodarchaeota archaeon]
MAELVRGIILASLEGHRIDRIALRSSFLKNFISLQILELIDKWLFDQQTFMSPFTIPNLDIMKILILADVLYPDTIGGAGRVVYHLALELSGKGHRIYIITRNHDGKWPSQHELAPNLFVHRFFSPSKESLGLFLREIRNSYHLAKKLSHKINFDLVCSHQSLVALGPLLLRNFRQIPLFHYFHSPWYEEFLVKKQEDRTKTGKRNKIIAFVMRRIEKRILCRADRVIVLSEYMRDRAVEIHNYPEDRVMKIPGGVDLDRYNLPIGGKGAAKEAVKLSTNKTIFLTVRNLVPRMGLEALIESFSKSRVLRDKGLLLIGGRGFLESNLKAQVESSDLNDTVRFLGYVSDEELLQVYQASDFFVLPTRELEGFGLVILEAMASGTPVLGTPIGGIPELIGAFDKRLIFDGTGWQDMRNKLEEVIERPDKFRFDPQDCRTFVEERFSWKKAADAFEQETERFVEEGK